MEKIEGRNGYRVLDHGMVALVEHMGNDLSIVRNARLPLKHYAKNWKLLYDIFYK